MINKKLRGKLLVLTLLLLIPTKQVKAEEYGEKGIDMNESSSNSAEYTSDSTLPKEKQIFSSQDIESNSFEAQTKNSNSEGLLDSIPDFDFEVGKRSNLIENTNDTKISGRSVKKILSAADKSLPAKSFIDVSSHNNVISVEDYLLMKEYGVKGVVVKLTEHTTYFNPLAKSQIENAQKAGLIVSVYHYSWFSTALDAKKEAEFFAQKAASLNLPKSTLMVNDAEQVDMKLGNVTANSLVFASELNRLGYNRVAHYSMYEWFRTNVLDINQLGVENCWVAQYPYTPSNNNLLHTNYSAWQWSSELTFPGVSGVFDISVSYNGLFTTTGNPTDYDIEKENFYGTPQLEYGIWDSYYPGSNNLGSLATYLGKEVKIIREASLGNSIWYQLSYEGNTLGWSNSAAIKTFGIENSVFSLNLYGRVKANNPNGIWSGYWSGCTKNDDLSNFEGKEIKINRSVKISGNTWYQIQYEGKEIGWASSWGIQTYTLTDILSETKLYGQAVLNDNGIWDGYWSGCTKLGNIKDYAGKELKVEKSLKVNGVLWYQISFEGKTIGWIGASGLRAYQLEDVAIQTKLYGQAVLNNNGIWDGYWSGCTKLGNIKDYAGKELKVEKSLKVNGILWYQISFEGKTIGWIGASGLRAYQLEDVTIQTKLYGQAVLNNNGIWDGYWSGCTKLGSIKDYAGKEIKVEKSLKVNGILWYQISFEGKMIGWAGDSGLNTYILEDMKIETNLYGEAILNDNGIWDGYWSGCTRLGNIKDYAGKKLKIEKSLKINGILWYQISFEGKMIGWAGANGINTYIL